MATVPYPLLGHNGHTPEAIFGCQSVNGHGASPAGITHTRPALAEAPCSVNGYFQVEGFPRDFQVTGRGHTPREAAANLKTTIDATRAALAPPAMPSREAQVASLLAKGIACAVKHQDMSLMDRLSKAAYLVLSDAIEPTDNPVILAVRSQQYPDSWYEVAGKVCTCPDFQKHLAAGESHYTCKHVLSVLMHQRLVA